MKKGIVLILSLLTTSTFAQMTTQRNGLAEEFGSAHCPPCKTFFDNYHPALVSLNANDTAAHLNAITYQMFYPGSDPSYNLHARQRYDYYTILGIPDLKINGSSIYTGATYQQLHTALDTSRNEPAEIKITGNYIIDPQTNIMDITVKVMPLNDIKQSLKVHVAVLEHHYTYTGNTIGQPDYYFVMRRMFPDGNGIKEDTWSSNIPKNYQYTQSFVVSNPPLYGSFDFWGNPLMSDLLVFVQDSASRKIYQSQIIKSSLPGMSIKNTEKEETIACFPNPASNLIYLGINNKRNQSYQISVYSLDGRIVHSEPTQILQAGRHSIQLNISNWTNGVYTVVIEHNQTRTIKKVVVKN